MLKLQRFIQTKFHHYGKSGTIKSNANRKRIYRST